MAGRCPRCGNSFSIGPERRRVTSITGQTVCARCDGRVIAAAAGILANPGSPVVGAVATVGWWERVRRFRRRLRRGSAARNESAESADRADRTVG